MFPTPEEIRAVTAEIRRDWSDRERRKRCVMAASAVEVLEVHVEWGRHPLLGD